LRIIPYEDKRAIELLNKGNLSKSLRNDLCILGKYYKVEISKDKEEIKKFLRGFCEWRIDDYNEILYFDIIKSAVNYSSKNDLFIARPVEVTKDELQKINKIKNKNKELQEQMKKCLFTLLVLSKLYNQKIEIQIQNKKTTKKKKEKLEKTRYYFKESLREICKVANIKILIKNQEDLIIQLYKDGLLDISNNSAYKPLIINENYQETDIVLRINNFQDLGLQYLLCNGDENIIQCENCGKYIIKKNGKIKYCRQCAKEIHKKTDREYQKNKYNKKILD